MIQVEDNQTLWLEVVRLDVSQLERSALAEMVRVCCMRLHAALA